MDARCCPTANIEDDGVLMGGLEVEFRDVREAFFGIAKLAAGREQFRLAICRD